MHEIVQSLVGTDVALGVVPLGTANALASNLKLIGSPAKVARNLLEATPSRVPVGRIHYQDTAGNPGSRYFVVAAGVGADALLMSRLDARLKRRLGYIVYLIEAFRIWATDSFPLFQAAMRERKRNHARRRGFAVAGSAGALVRRRSARARSRSHAAQRQSELAGIRDTQPSALLRFLLAVVAGRHTFANNIELFAGHLSRVPARATVQPRKSSSKRMAKCWARCRCGLKSCLTRSTLLVPPDAQP